MYRTYTYPLQPTKKQEKSLKEALKQCCAVYNAGLEQQKEVYRKTKKFLSRQDQQIQLTELRHFDIEYTKVAVSIQRSALFRLERGLKSFLECKRAGKKRGFPRFKNINNFRSFSFAKSKLQDNKISIPNIGQVKFKKYRPYKGVCKEARIIKSISGWKLSIICNIGEAPNKNTPTTFTGVDVGLESFLTTSEGDHVSNPRFFRQSEELLARRQQTLAKKQKGSNSRQRQKPLVAKAHQKIRSQRLDFARKLAKTLFSQYDMVAFEKLNIKGMVQHPTLSKSISDASWGIFIQCLINKAEEAGLWAMAVDPRGTSQRCSGCNETVPKSLGDREHYCQGCGLRLHRDHNAACNILALGLSVVEDGLHKKTDKTEVRNESSERSRIL